MNVVQLSENTLVVLYEQTISLDISSQIIELTRAIEDQLSDYVVDIVPSYASIHILFDLRKVSGQVLGKKLEELANKIGLAFNQQEMPRHSQEIVEIPVFYDSQVGLDLDLIAASSNMTKAQVISIHSERIYDVYAMGFAPGFAYLGSVDECISMPRKDSPRKHIPAGSLGIAGQQTAIYPTDSPGGWQIIGRTPLELVNYENDQPTIVKTGDRVKFVAIDERQFIQLGGKL